VSPPDEAESTRARLARLNDAYEDWFGFRYCVFVAGRPLEALVPELEAAMSRPRDQELRRGVDAVIDIAIARSGAAR
jgi:2-oxo-4-hydroxy-4-carboxy--5-ureidoimidazoline (OHCU) decarboxylase